MRLLPLSSLCLVALVLVVAGKYDPEPYDPAQAPIYQESLESLLTGSCRGSQKCSIWSVIAAEVCSFPTRQKECQSDCKFLLDLIWRDLESPPLGSQLKKYVPDDCVPERRSSYDKLLRASSTRSGKPKEEQRSFGSDEEDRLVRSRAVDPTRNVTYCFDLSGSKQVPAGEAWKSPCSQQYGEFFSGDILHVCSYTGTILKTKSRCNFDETKAAKQSNALAVRARDTRQATDIDAKQVFEDGAKIMKELSEFLSSDKVKDFLSIAGSIASVLGPIGSAFQLVAFFLPESDPKFDAIMEQFKEMTMKFAEISNQISRLEDAFVKEIWNGKMDEPVKNLIYLEQCITDYSNQRTKPFLDDVKSACANFPGKKFVTDMLYVMSTKSSAEIAKIYGYNRKKFSNQFAKAMLVYSVRGASAAIHCLGLHKDATESDTRRLGQSQQKLVTSLHKIVNDLYYDFIPNNAMANYLPTDVDNFLATYHSSANDKIADVLYNHLSETYDWYYGFGVAVYQNTDSDSGAIATKCNRCLGQENSGSYHVVHSSFGKTVYLAYGVKPTPDMEQYVIDVYNYAGRASVQPVANYFVNKGKRAIRNALVVRFGHELRVTMSSAVKFYNVQSTSIMISL